VGSEACLRRLSISVCVAARRSGAAPSMARTEAGEFHCILDQRVRPITSRASSVEFVRSRRLLRGFKPLIKKPRCNRPGARIRRAERKCARPNFRGRHQRAGSRFIAITAACMHNRFPAAGRRPARGESSARAFQVGGNFGQDAFLRCFGLKGRCVSTPRAPCLPVRETRWHSLNCACGPAPC